MNSNAFISLRLTGSRFNEYGLPVALFPDFKALEDLLIMMAKEKYFEDHPQRSRVPRGFTKDIELQLVHMDEGSLFLSFQFAGYPDSNDPTIFPQRTENDFYLQKSKEELISLVTSLNEEDSISIPSNYRSRLEQLGKNLREDEVIDFGYDPVCKTESDALLNHAVREKIRNYTPPVEEIKEIHFFARIPGIDQKKNQFKIETETKTIYCPLNHSIHTDVLNAVNGYTDGLHVRVKAKAIMNPEDIIKKIEKVESIDILDPMDVSHRLHQLAALEDRWYEGHGVAPSEEGLKEFERLFYKYFDKNLPLPAIFPTIEGNIQLEWQHDNKNIILEVDLQSFQSEYFYFDSLDDTIEEESNYPLSEDHGWETLCKEIEKIFRE